MCPERRVQSTRTVDVTPDSSHACYGQSPSYSTTVKSTLINKSYRSTCSQVRYIFGANERSISLEQSIMKLAHGSIITSTVRAGIHHCIFQHALAIIMLTYLEVELSSQVYTNSTTTSQIYCLWLMNLLYHQNIPTLKKLFCKFWWLKSPETW